MNTTEKWQNFGDVNFYEYGGCLVQRAHTAEEREAFPTLANMYAVILYNPEVDDEDKGRVMVGVQTVDIDDINDELKRDLLYVIGEEARIDESMFDIMAPEMWAKELAEYRGYNGAMAPFKMYGWDRNDYLVSKAAAVRFMRNNGVDAETSGFYDRVMEEYEEMCDDVLERYSYCNISFTEFLREKLKSNKENPPKETSDELDISDITDEEIKYLLNLEGKNATVSDIRGKITEDVSRICGIIFEHGQNDFGLWEGFRLTEEEENAIQQILMKHDTEGCSVRGTKIEIAEELK